MHLLGRRTRFASGITRKIWMRLLGEESWTERYGDFRQKERLGLIQRQSYAYGMLRAADVARYFGKKSATVIEFGVAAGAGLLNMTEIAPLIEEETDVELRIVGFDTGAGLPQLRGFKDHPELWSGGDFATGDREALLQKVDGKADIVWGNIEETIAPFVRRLAPTAPIGFISVDVDVYSATKAALRCLAAPAELLAPAVSMYFDDVGFFFANEWCGELAAIREFNDDHDLRKIDEDRSLPSARPKRAEPWYRSMYVCHVLDHEFRNKTRARGELTMTAHHEFMSSSHLY